MQVLIMPQSDLLDPRPRDHRQIEEYLRPFLLLCVLIIECQDVLGAPECLVARVALHESVFDRENGAAPLE